MGSNNDRNTDFPVAASAVTANPVRDSFASNLARRAEEQELKTKEDYYKLLPAECKDKCEGSAWTVDAFWGDAKCLIDFNGDACHKVVCDTLQQTADCTQCITISELKKLGKTPSEAEIKEFDAFTKETVQLEQENCKKLGKRDVLGAFHARGLVERASDKEIEDWQNELKAVIDPKCIDICKTTVFSGRPWIDACHVGDVKDCSKFTCARIDQMTACSFCISESDFKAAGIDGAALEEQRKKYEDEAKKTCQDEGYGINTA